jgi:hypothetical protein
LSPDPDPGRGILGAVMLIAILIIAFIVTEKYITGKV